MAGGGALIGSIIFPGVGTLIGGIVGGLVGGIGGAAAGGAIDGAVWDKSEDAIMNAYQFFGWHDVSRNTRPQKEANEFVKAFDNAVDNKKPNKTTKEDWHQACLAYFMVLLRAMYPVSQEILQEIERIHKIVENNPSMGPIFQMLQNGIEEEE